MSEGFEMSDSTPIAPAPGYEYDRLYLAQVHAQSGDEQGLADLERLQQLVLEAQERTAKARAKYAAARMRFRAFETALSRPDQATGAAP